MIAKHRENKGQAWSKRRRLIVGAVFAAMLIYLVVSCAISSNGAAQTVLYDFRFSGFDALVLFSCLGIFGIRKIYAVVKEKWRK